MRTVAGVVCAMLTLACGAPGPMGPAGPMGPQGAPGQVGPSGQTVDFSFDCELSGAYTNGGSPAPVYAVLGWFLIDVTDGAFTTACSGSYRLAALSNLEAHGVNYDAERFCEVAVRPSGVASGDSPAGRWTFDAQTQTAMVAPDHTVLVAFPVYRLNCRRLP